MDQIQHEVHENTPLVYHGVGDLVEVARHKTEQVWQLQLMKLNASQKLLGKACALDEHKQWMMCYVLTKCLPDLGKGASMVTDTRYNFCTPDAKGGDCCQ